NGHPEKRTVGIYITTVADDIKPTRYNDILIENCHIHHIQNQGIATSHEKGVFDYPEGEKWENRKMTNLIIRNNVIHHISKNAMIIRDRKSTRLNSSHVKISYAVFCLKKKRHM